MIDFTIPVETVAFLERLEAFLDEHVTPAEAGLVEEDFESGRVERELLPPLRQAARKAGVYTPQLAPGFGGLGLEVTALALASERCGPHALGSLSINCMAPDEANMFLLEHYGTPAQQERWLEPLAAGRIRSCFGMTEPDAGSDPRRIASRAEELPGGGFRIDAHKVLTTGALGAAFSIVMAVTEPQARPGRGVSMLIVPTDAPGFEVVRDLKTMGFTSLGGHPETRWSGVVVGPEALLGARGAGFEMAQSRLGVGRMGHAMRWIGIAQRCVELSAKRSLERETFGAPLASRQAVQWWLADGATLVQACRLMVLHACWKIERGLPHRTEVSMVKTFVAEALGEIVDKALQVHGGWGYTDDFPFARWYRDARAARIYDGPSEVHRIVVARAVLGEVAATGRALEACGDLLAPARRGR